MEIIRAKELLSLLADGIDPATGEIFPPESPYQNPDIIRALFTALKYLDKVEAKTALPADAPGNAGVPWTPEQEEALAAAFHEGTPVQEIAAQSGRTKGAITARLKRLGLIPY